jgi:hypothetical protein
MLYVRKSRFFIENHAQAYKVRTSPQSYAGIGFKGCEKVL